VESGAVDIATVRKRSDRGIMHTKSIRLDGMYALWLRLSSERTSEIPPPTLLCLSSFGEPFTGMVIHLIGLGVQRKAPLSVPLLNVCKAVPLVWQWHERLGEDLYVSCIHTELAFFSSLYTSPRPYDVSSIYQALQTPAIKALH